MISPLPRNKRAKHPRDNGESPAAVTQSAQAPERPPRPPAAAKPEVNVPSFANNPFAQLDANKVAS